MTEPREPFPDPDDHSSIAEISAALEIPRLTQAAYDDCQRRFTHHPAIGDQPRRYLTIREHAKQLALVVCGLVPDSREKSLALTKIEEAVMWANAGIARNDSPAV